MLHKHHIIPLYTCTNLECPKDHSRKHICGLDDPSNIEYITVEEHAEKHRLLFEQYGRWEDKLAYEGLFGLKDHAECAAEASRLANTGKYHTPESRQKRRIKQLAKIAAGTHTPPTTKGIAISQKWGKKISVALKGNQNGLGTKRTEEQRKRMSEAQQRRFGEVL